MTGTWGLHLLLVAFLTVMQLSGKAFCGLGCDTLDVQFNILHLQTCICKSCEIYCARTWNWARGISNSRSVCPRTDVNGNQMKPTRNPKTSPYNALSLPRMLRRLSPPSFPSVPPTRSSSLATSLTALRSSSAMTLRVYSKLPAFSIYSTA